MVTDNFNRANGGLGANWTTDSAFSALTIVSNACKGSTGGAHNVAVYTAAGTAPANQYAQVKVTTIGGYIGPVLRSNGAGTFYTCYYPPSTGNVTIYKWIAGSGGGIVSGSIITPAVNDVIYFEAVGTTLTMKVNGVTVATVGDGAITGAGYTGIDIFDNVGAVDDFEATSTAVNVNVSLTGVAADPQIGTGTFQIGVVVLLTGVSANPLIGTGTVQIGGIVVTPPVQELVPGRNWYGILKDETVYLTGVAALPRIGNGTVHVTLGGRVPEHLYFPKRQPEPIDSSGLVGDLAKSKILSKTKPPTISVELIQPPPVVVKKPTVFVQLTGVEVARVEKVIERYEEEMLAFLDSL